MHAHNSVNAREVDTSILAQKPVPTNMQKLGHLMVEIALGNVDMPTEGEAAAKLLKAHGVHIPDGVSIELRRRDPKHMVIMVPPKEMVEAAICEARKLDDAGERYINIMLPDYKEVLDGSWFAQGKTNEDFYDVRVADYTMSFCR